MGSFLDTVPMGLLLVLREGVGIGILLWAVPSKIPGSLQW